MDFSYTTGSDLTYLAISAGVTVWVARTLVRNGRIFLVDAFGGNEPLADAVNHLLAVGFYLINLGYVALHVETWQDPATLSSAIELVAGKVGQVLVILGLMHFFNLWLFSRMRRKGLARLEPPPVLPNEFLPPRRAAQEVRA
jgi:hypothetical protein